MDQPKIDQQKSDKKHFSKETSQDIFCSSQHLAMLVSYC